MFPDLAIARSLSCLALTSTVVEALRTTATRDELSRLMAAVPRAMKFRYYALIHHDHLRTPQPDLVDLKDYPPAIASGSSASTDIGVIPSFAAAYSRTAHSYGPTCHGLPSRPPL